MEEIYDRERNWLVQGLCWMDVGHGIGGCVSGLCLCGGVGGRGEGARRGGCRGIGGSLFLLQRSIGRVLLLGSVNEGGRKGGTLSPALHTINGLVCRYSRFRINLMVEGSAREWTACT